MSGSPVRLARILTCLTLALFVSVAIADEAEFRGLWVDAFHAGYKTPEEVSKLIADTRAAHCNALIVEVRKRGDAYYNSKFEPKAPDITPDFDPLADLIAKAHDTRKGPRIEIHAWIVAYPVWGSQKSVPALPNHPYRLHPDWLTKDFEGTSWNGSAYDFDPGHPDVQKYLFDVSMDIITRYDVDGFQFDHIRYDRNTFGYNDTTVARFNARFGRTGKPKATDPDWLQFRRDQVTALVRKVYLSAIAIKPKIKISVAGNTRAPGVATTKDWPRSAAFSSTLQDWRAWTEEGIVDIAMPMTYFRQQQWGSAWDKWSQFHKDHRYDRHVVIGPGPYLNLVSNSLYQLRTTRQATPSGNRADGVTLYCYAELSNDGVSRDEFLKALTTPSAFDPNPVFASVVPTPVMPWKTKPTKGYLKGFVFGPEKKPLDGAMVKLNGLTEKTLLSDGTGFYGAVDLPPGRYVVTFSQAGSKPVTQKIKIKAGAVTTADLQVK